MASSIENLVSMGDVESLFEIMAEHDDWMTQLEAAEGLAKLGDKRGVEFLLSAAQDEDREVRELVGDILDSPLVKRRLEDIRADEEELRARRLETARNRLQGGRKVFRYKMVYLPADEILNEDPLSEGFEIPALDEFGYEGWEVINFIPRRRQVMATSADDHLTGVYFLLKREVAGDEHSELQ